MQNGSNTPGLGPVQAGVQIVQDMIQCGMSGQDYEAQLRALHMLMSDFARREMRGIYAQDLIDTATDEENENDPAALAYWAATSLFFRRVYSASASAA